MQRLFPAIVALAVCLGVGAASGEEPPQYLLEWSVPGFPGHLGAPWNITVDSGFNVLVTQTQPNQLDRYSTMGELQLYNSPSVGGCTSYPGGVSVGPDGSIYVAAAGCHRIAKLNPTLNLVAAWGGIGTGNGQFIVPLGVTADPLGNVFVADTYNNRIQKFDGAGAYLRQWGHFGTAPGDFQNPFALACDSNGDVYVMDTANHRIQVFDGNGTLQRLWEVIGDDYYQSIGPAGMTLDREANVYVADTYNQRVLKFDSHGSLLSSWGSYGSGPGQFIYPHGVGVDDSGHVYVADTGNGRIQKFAQALQGQLRVEPRVIQISSQARWVTAIVTPPATYLAANVEAASLEMNGVAVDLEGPIAIGDANSDGKQDLSVKFDRGAIVATRTDDRILPLLLTGRVSGMAFVCRDTVRLTGGPQASATPVPSVAEPESDAIELRVRQIPARGGTILAQIRLPAASGERATLSVFDVRGRRVHDAMVDAPGPGSRQVRIDLPRELGAGIYLLRLSHGTTYTSLRVPVIR